MPGEAVAANERVLGGRAAGVGFDVGDAPRAFHFDEEFHEILVEKPRLGALVDRRELFVRGRSLGAPCGPQEARPASASPTGKSTAGRTPYSAASEGWPRREAMAESSAMSCEARAIGFVR